MNRSYDLCTASMRSMTYALKTQRLLEAAGVYSYIVKLDSSATRRGCAYGITFYCASGDTVRRILRSERISVSQYIMGGGEKI